MQAKTKEAQDRLAAAIMSKCGPGVVFNEGFRSTKANVADSVYSKEVSLLGYPDEDSDDD